MPYVSCPVCARRFHLLINGDRLEEWFKKHPGPEHLELCIFCWGTLKPGQTVKVRWLRDETRDQNSQIEIGDVGAIAEVLRATNADRVDEGADDEYLVTSLLPDGALKWTAKLLRRELERVLHDPHASSKS